jgi:hypothetical protein
MSANIVEGYAMRKYKAVYLHHLYRAYSSALEAIEPLNYHEETDSLKNMHGYPAIHSGYVLLCRKCCTFIRGVANFMNPGRMISGLKFRSDYKIPNLGAQHRYALTPLVAAPVPYTRHHTGYP